MVRVTCPALDVRVHLRICAFVYLASCFLHLLSALAFCTLRLLVFSVKNTKIFKKFLK